MDNLRELGKTIWYVAFMLYPLDHSPNSHRERHTSSRFFRTHHNWQFPKGCHKSPREAIKIIFRSSHPYDGKTVSLVPGSPCSKWVLTFFPSFRMGWDFALAFTRYGDDWHRRRRMFQQTFKRDASLNYHPIQTRKIHEMLQSLLETPEDFNMHSKTQVHITYQRVPTCWCRT